MERNSSKSITILVRSFK